MSTGSSDVNVRLSSQARGWRYGTCGMTGVVFPSFTSGSNGSPKKPFTGVMAYPTIKGVMRLSSESDSMVVVTVVQTERQLSALPLVTAIEVSIVKIYLYSTITCSYNQTFVTVEIYFVLIDSSGTTYHQQLPL